nr:PH domain-containing protein [Rhodococcus sp. SORGH_AS_0303]
MMGNAGRIDPQAAQPSTAGSSATENRFLFTNRRLIMVDKQGIAGREVEDHCVLCRAITHFSVKSAATFDLDAELKIWISGNPAPIEKQFNKSVDIYEVQGILSHFVAV